MEKFCYLLILHQRQGMYRRRMLDPTLENFNLSFATFQLCESDKLINISKPFIHKNHEQDNNQLPSSTTGRMK